MPIVVDIASMHGMKLGHGKKLIVEKLKEVGILREQVILMTVSSVLDNVNALVVLNGSCVCIMRVCLLSSFGVFELVQR